MSLSKKVKAPSSSPNTGDEEFHNGYLSFILEALVHTTNGHTTQVHPRFLDPAPQSTMTKLHYDKVAHDIVRYMVTSHLDLG